MTYLTWADITQFIQEYQSAEGVNANRTLYDMLGNQALRIISERTQLYVKEWDNDSGGDLTISTNTVTLPADCIGVTRVEWDGTDSPLTRMTESQLDHDYPGWREDTGDPQFYCTPDAHTLMLSSAPSGTVTGKLVVRGPAYLPDFSSVAGAQNPMEYIPVGSQLAVAHYIISQLPVVPAQPTSDSREAIMAAQTETQRRVQVRTDFANQFEAAIATVAANVNRKRRKPFRY